MNTHIIIPIKDIEKIYKIKDTFKRAVEFNKILQGAKQISLDEKDILTKADSYTRNKFGEVDDLWDVAEAYKQALKDLL